MVGILEAGVLWILGPHFGSVVSSHVRVEACVAFKVLAGARGYVTFYNLSDSFGHWALKLKDPRLSQDVTRDRTTSLSQSPHSRSGLDLDNFHGGRDLFSDVCGADHGPIEPLQNLTWFWLLLTFGWWVKGDFIRHVKLDLNALFRFRGLLRG